MRRSLPAAVFCAIVAASAPGAGHADTVEPSAADGSLGTAMMYAAVRSLGDLAHGAGVVSSERVSTGWYRVVFQRSTNNCGISATTGNVDPGDGAAGFGSASVESGLTNPQIVTVATRNDAGTAQDRGFFVTVFCAR